MNLDYFAQNSGDWSTLSNWASSDGIVSGLAGALPDDTDDVYSNNSIIYIDNDYSVKSIRNIEKTYSFGGISSGGFFVANNGITLSAFVYGGGVTEVACLQFLSAAPSFATLVGNLCAGDPAAAVLRPIAFRNVSTGDFTIIGDSLGGFNNNSNADLNNALNGIIINSSSGNLTLVGTFSGDIRLPTAARQLITIRNQDTGTINISGTVIGGTGSNTYGANNSSTGTISIQGTALGGSGSVAVGVNNVSTGTISIQGTALGGTGSQASGVQNNSTGTINISGTALGGSGSLAHGVNNVSTGILNFQGTAIGSATNTYGVNNNSTGTINISGTAIGGFGSSAHGVNNSTGILNFQGTAIGGSGNSSSGINNNSTGTVNITGTVIGGTASGASGARNASIGTIDISGTAIGGTGSNTIGAWNNSTGTISIQGTALGGTGSNAFGARNLGSGTIILFSAIGGIASAGISNDGTNGRVEVKRAIGNDFGIGSTGIAAAQVGVANARSGIAVVEEIECGPRGAFPTSGPIFFKKTSDSVAIYRNSSGDQITMFTSASGSNLVPSPQDVRKDVEYDFGSRTGTLAMPAPETVNFGVPVDDTVGAGVFTPLGVWNLPVSAIDINVKSMGNRVKNSATINAVGSLITNLT
jgi:hypothetical protein